MKHKLTIILIALNSTLVFATGLVKKQDSESQQSNHKAVKTLVNRYQTIQNSSGVKCESKKFCEFKFRKNQPSQ